MYTEFFGLTEKPFNPVPNPRFVHWTTGHREALSQLQYGIEERRGFLVLTGEVGTGKTTIVKALVDELPPSTKVSVHFHSRLSFRGILEVLFEDLGIAEPGGSDAQRILALRNYLIEQGRLGDTTLLILDEAQNLTTGTLESVRLLSNFETSSEKLLQILLVGQPELERKLKRARLRQLDQRIGVRCRLHPLRPYEAGDFVRHRLTVAGASDANIFEPSAIRRIGAYAQGVPRVMNALCDHCLLIGYADEKPRIDGVVVETAIEYLEGRRETVEDDWGAEWETGPSPSTEAASVAMGAAPAESNTVAAVEGNATNQPGLPTLGMLS